MPKEDFAPGDRVVNVQTKRRGTVVEDIWAVCGEEEVPVQYDGDPGFNGTDHIVLFKLD